MAGLPLRLFNTLGRELQRFVPLEAGRAHVYTCGPTVYAYQHIGNLRASVFADTLRRVLEWKGYEVTHVINITDVGQVASGPRCKRATGVGSLGSYQLTKEDPRPWPHEYRPLRPSAPRSTSCSPTVASC
jgi:hypothetical protein